MIYKYIKIHLQIKRLFSHKKAGFTIIETLMAVLVLSIAMAGALALASRGLDTVLIARQQVSAVYLAQDAMEYIRATRDTNCLAAYQSNPTASCPSNAWLGGTLTMQCATNQDCYIDTITGTITRCSGTCPVLNYDSANTVYTYAPTNGTTIAPTIYTRSIYIQTPVGVHADEASTSIIVSWPSVGGITRSIRIHDDLFNWE
jgi:prepilin-type N-terminal cleavage/methylation domain-containing protein